MIKRFRLELKGVHEKLVIAHRLAEMLDSFIDGRTAAVEMGSEQGDIKEWDDFIVRHSDDVFEHVQIKKQSTDFCTKAPTRPAVNNAFSVVDNAFISLAEWSRLATPDELNSRTFVLSVPGLGLRLKKELSVNHLDELCMLCKQDGISIAALEARNDGPTTRAFQWLTTWCGFDDWTHVLKTLKRVTVRLNGADADLKERAIVALRRHFTDPERVHQALLSYITAQTSDVSSITSRAVLRHVYPMLRPEFSTWTQYRLDNLGDPWLVSGTHGLEIDDPESASAVVQGLWRGGGSHRKLRVAAEYASPNPSVLSLPTAILRLALHLQGASQSLMINHANWQASAMHELGYTLGIGENDLDHLPWCENPETLNPGSHRPLAGLSASRQEAAALALAMDDAVWVQVVARVVRRLENIVDPDLLMAMETMWGEWRKQLEQAAALRSTLLSQLLYPISEGKNHAHALRVGPRTVDLLATALETLLLVAVAVGGDGSDWQSFPNCGQVNTIALKHWSGPSGSVPSVRELSSDDLSVLLGPSPTPVVVLSGVEAPSSALLEVGMADDAAITTSMGAPRQPLLLVTRARIAHQLRTGTLASVRDHFGQQWRSRVEARQAAISAIEFGA
ncbi:ABC-three component system protein [Pseudomonas fragi]|uniref:ABC-three component system protein n=1 Tax=Pseudomonas fragi TaxID=296 RepID=UPI0014728192|nr:ABC-three component system protein [Pseudomonas fragi]NNB17744.1 hypothetical protein [Pseudomonas fragi]NNB19636.1 hypothetical protein [Pseudomonas fragi]